MRIPRVYKNDNNKISDKITTIDIKSEQLDPIVYIPDVDFDDQKSVNRYVKAIKSVVRNSTEYRQLMRFLKKELNINSCLFYPKVKKYKDKKISIEIHHTGFVMEDIIRTILVYRYKNNLDYDVQSVAEHIMLEHYKGNISLTALSATAHDLIHEENSNLFIPLQYCDFGDINKFYNEYKDFVDKETVKKFEQYKILSDVVDNIEDIIPDYMKKNIIYYNCEGIDIPNMDKILDIVKIEE